MSALARTLPEPESARESPPRRIGATLARLARKPQTGAVLAAALVYLFFAIAAAGKGFVTVTGTASWLNTAAELGIIAVPVGLLMIAGEFDLSVGSIVGASTITVAVGSGYFSLALPASIALALLMGLLVGLGNGLLVVRTGMPSFIVTLAANLVLVGLALGLSRSLAGSSVVSLTSGGISHRLLGSSWRSFNVSILWWLAVALLAGWVLVRARFGNWIYATGGNQAGAKSAGVPTDRVKIILFMATGLCAALVGVIQALEFGNGNAVNGQGFVFQAPIAAVIGGVLLTGRYGSVTGVVMGTIIYGIVNLGLFYTGWDTDYAQTFIGALLLLAVLANGYFRQLALRAGGAS